MARTTRVQPDGSFASHPARGQFMGNRGCLHDAGGAVRRPWAGKAWITCTLHERADWGPHPFPVPGRWTPLFFLDEAVAAAAGHRPCALCRRAAYDEFRAAWGRAFGKSVTAAEMDMALHLARIDPATRQQRRHLAQAQALPDGVFVADAHRTLRLEAGQAWPLTSEGYGRALPLPMGPVQVLTPAPLVAVMACGWRPVLNAALDRPKW